LKSLSDKKLIKSDPENNWTWDQQEIDRLGYTDNVIDLMTGELAELPDQTRESLQFAAVLGNRFNFADLSQILEKTGSKVFSDLKPAIKGGYIGSTDINYRTLALRSFHSGTEPAGNILDREVHFKFTHDKVQQAAYNLISEPDRILLHLKIGRLMLKNRNTSQLNDDVFEVINHFLLSSHLVEDKKEKLEIVRLCLIAGRKAKDSTSYPLGVVFLSLGRNLLGSDCWIENHELTYNVHTELGECEYLNNNPEKAEIHFREILGHSKTNLEKLKVYYIHSSLYLKIGNTSESLRLGLEAAKLYHIHFPKNKKAIQAKAIWTMAKYLVLFSTKYKNPESLFHLKDCSDEETIALNKFLIDLATSAYQQDQNLMMLVIFEIIKSYIEKGFTDASGWGFSGFSVVVLSALNLQKRGFDLWDITRKLHQRTHSPLIRWRLSYTVLCFHNPWRVPHRKSYEPVLETIKASVMNGDQIFTGYSIALYTRIMVAAGENLRIIVERSDEHKSLMKNSKGGLDFFICFYQFAKALNGQTYADSWDDDDFKGAETWATLLEEGNRTKLSFYHSNKSSLLYFLGHYDEALAESVLVEQYAENFLGDLQSVSHTFYTSLSIAACYDSLNQSERKGKARIFKKNLNHMRLWAKGCPENYLQHYYLMQAEFLAMNNEFEKALKVYEKAIQLAAQNEITYVEAIANERAAGVCSKIGLSKHSQVYREDSWAAYAKWGALVKCRQLENDYPELLKGKSKGKESEEIPGNYSSTSSSSKTALDLASVLKASQSIAGQVRYEDLLKKLMHITIENAGAERACLLLLKDNHLCIEAVGISGKEGIEIYPSVPLSALKLLPESIVNYCLRTAENVVVDDAVEESRFSTDPYVTEHKLLSVMCLPISAVGKTIGLLYFENNLIKGVFNKSRIEILQMLLGQIGISLENAKLYGNLEEKVRERTKEIEKAYAELKATQAQLIQAEKMASLGELTAGIAHEIQNPLNFVNNFSEVSSELIEEVKESRSKSQDSRPRTEEDELEDEILEDIKQNLKKINHHGKRADSIVKGMLEHSRVSSGEKVPTNINALADEYLRLSYHGLRAKDKSFNADFKTDFDPNLPKVNVVPQDIGRVLLNIINNAFQACSFEPSKGSKPLEGFRPTVSLTTQNLGEKIQITIQDNGPGIPESIKDKIFQPFFTTKPTGQGTGLGLSLSYDIVKAHGGEIVVGTKEGHGTEFLIYLPYI
jgi:histidine kinase